MCSSCLEVCCQAYGPCGAWDRMVALLTRGLVASAVALALKPFTGSPLSPAKGYQSPCSSAFYILPIFTGLCSILFFLINSLIDKCLICLCVSVSVAVGSLCFKIHHFDCAPQSLKLRRCLLKCILSRKLPSLPFERDAHCSSGV